MLLIRKFLAKEKTRLHRYLLTGVIITFFFLQLTNPHSLMDQNILLLLSGILIGYLEIPAGGLVLKFLLATVSVFLFWSMSAYPGSIPINISLLLSGAFIGAIVNRVGKGLIIYILLVAFLLTSFLNSQELRSYISVNPAPHSYTRDMGLYLKTYYFMEKNSYYQSYKLAFINHCCWISPPTDLWGWRLPTAFYLWRLVPGNNGANIFWLFTFLALIAMYGIYDNAKKILPHNMQFLAILPSAIIFPYFHFAARDWTILQVEWWAIVFVLIGFWLYVRKHWLLAVAFFTVGLCTRELLLIPFLLMLILRVWYYLSNHGQHKEDLPPLWVHIIPVLIFILFLCLHAYLVSHTIILKETAFQPRVNGGLALLRNTLAFGSWEYLLFKIRPILLSLLLIIPILLYKINWLKRCVLCFAVLGFSYIFIGTGSLNEAWGVLYLPPILTLGLTLLLSDLQYKN